MNLIAIPTVLVLGAGASAPYGFPTGPMLKNLICSEHKVRQLRDVATALEINNCLVDELIEKLRKGSAQSIDALLEQRPHLVNVGKNAIAMTLIEYERESSLLPPNAPNLDWYVHLGTNLLSQGVDGLSDNEITIVTFNYDRSLEYRLALLLSADYDVDLDEAIKRVSQLEIIHCHGTLGALDSELPNYRPYDPSITPDRITTAADSIQIIHEANDGAQAFADALTAIRNADRLYFLGFGYHPLNMKRLGVHAPGHFSWKQSVKLFINCNGFHELQLKWLRDSYGLDPKGLHHEWGNNVEYLMTRTLEL